MATTKYELYKKGNYTSLTKTVTVSDGDHFITVSVSAYHVKGGTVDADVSMSDWRGIDSRHAYWHFRNLAEGWAMFRNLLNLYRLEG